MTEASATLSTATELAISPPDRRAKRRPMSIQVGVFGVLAGLFVVLGILGPVVAGDPLAGSLAERLLNPGSVEHALGTDGQGRDVLTRLLVGARPAAITAIVPVLVAGALGIGLGIMSGLSGARIRALTMRVLDVFYAFPAVLLAIVISVALGSGTLTTVISLSIVLVPPIARIAETETVRYREWDFMQSAATSGASKWAIAWYQVLPNVLPPLIVYCTSLVGLALVFAGGLSFLGLGVAPPQPEWGQMLSEYQTLIFTNPTIALIPALAIFAASLVFNFLGDGLHRLFDVRRITA